MGFLTIVRKLRQKEKEMKILIIGLDNAGKTTIVKKFNNEPTDTVEPTPPTSSFEHRGFNLNFWDVGGQQTIRAYWRNYFEVTDGLIWVVDSADKWRLDTCRDELAALLDLPNALSPEEISEHLNLGSAQYANRHWEIQSCSARTGDGLVKGIDWMVDDVASRIMLR
ncbi:GTP binding protein [Aureococcus anophagefferens]|nr:GTP binding protein [Aureococcus anophagefferens]